MAVGRIFPEAFFSHGRVPQPVAGTSPAMIAKTSLNMTGLPPNKSQTQPI